MYPLCWWYITIPANTTYTTCSMILRRILLTFITPSIFQILCPGFRPRVSNFSDQKKLHKFNLRAVFISHWVLKRMLFKVAEKCTLSTVLKVADCALIIVLFWRSQRISSETSSSESDNNPNSCLYSAFAFIIISHLVLEISWIQ